MHYAIIVYRLRRDFGFTIPEVANFTGIEPRNVEVLHSFMVKVLASGLIKEFKKLKLDEEMMAWETKKYMGDGGKSLQGYYLVKDDPNWWEVTDEKQQKVIKNRQQFKEKRQKKYAESDVILGQESEKDIFNET